MDGIILATWAAVIVIVGLYVAFVVWRVRVHRRREAEKAGAAGAPPVGTLGPSTPRATRRDPGDAAEVFRAPMPRVDDGRLARAIANAARISGQAPKLPADEPPAGAVVAPGPPLEGGVTGAPAVDAAAAPRPPDDERRAGPETVVELLRGIALPVDLVPLTTMAPREGVRDRVAFWTRTAGADVVAPAFLDELRRIGGTVHQLDLHTFAVERDGGRASVVVHPDGHTAVVDGRPGFPSVPEYAVVVEVLLL